MLAVIMLYNAQQAYNKANRTAQLNYVSYNVTAGAQRTFTAALDLPARTVEDANGKLVTKAQNFVDGYSEWEAGTGELVGTESLPEAVVEIAERINYLENQIESNIVITQANQVTPLTNKDTGRITIAVAFPVEQSVEVDGSISTESLDYLYVLNI